MDGIGRTTTTARRPNTGTNTSARPTRRRWRPATACGRPGSPSASWPRTALLQLAIYLASGSVALLADTIHNADGRAHGDPTPHRLPAGPPAPVAPLPLRLPPGRGHRGARDRRALILVSAVLAAWEAIDRLRHPQEVTEVAWVLAAGLIGVAGNQVVAAYRIRVGPPHRIRGARRRWPARADRRSHLPRRRRLGDRHVRSGSGNADAVIGLVIVGAIVVTLVQAARSVLHRALDGTEESTIALIETVAASVPGSSTSARPARGGAAIGCSPSWPSTSTAACAWRRATRSPNACGRRCCTTSRAWPRPRSTSTRTSTPRIRSEAA